MDKEENKLFKFATKELSQDAFISWCINWFNYSKETKGEKDKEKLCEMSNKILDKILNSRKIESKEIKKISIIRQFENIDIIVVVTLKNSKQYLVIIEDKVGANLGSNQKNDLYVNKLTKALKNEPEKQNLISVSNFDEKNIVPVFWKTSKWNEEKEVLKKIEKNIGKEVICINGTDTLEMLKDYKDYSEIVEDFYICLKENLKMNNVIDQVSEIVKTQKIQIGTKFYKNYYCYNCFKNIIGKEYTSECHPQKGGMALVKLNKKIGKENLIHITTTLFNSNGNWKNRFEDDMNIWKEELSENLVKQGKLQTTMEYTFLFTKSRDEFRRDTFTFRGFYKLTKIDEKNRYRRWEKQNKNEEIVSIDEGSIIKSISNY